jgi:hypothetical protein
MKLKLKDKNLVIEAIPKKMAINEREKDMRGGNKIILSLSFPRQMLSITVHRLVEIIIPPNTCCHIHICT